MKLKRQRMPFRRRRLRHAPQEFDGPFESLSDIDHLVITVGTGSLKTCEKAPLTTWPAWRKWMGVGGWCKGNHSSSAVLLSGDSSWRCPCSGSLAFTHGPAELSCGRHCTHVTSAPVFCCFP